MALQTLEVSELGEILAALAQRGYRLLAPTIRDGAIVYDEIDSHQDLPIGWTDEQEAGSYRLLRREDEAVFGYVVGPHSWKRYLHPPALTLWRAERSEEQGFTINEERAEADKVAFIGVRACELHAIGIQDRVFLQGEHVDSHYRARRENAFVLAVNCSQAGGTCFCVSMNTGPKVNEGFDLSLTEVLVENRHFFTVEVGSDLGAEVLDEVASREATAAECQEADRSVQNAVEQMGRSLDTEGLKELLYDNLEHPRWLEVADRCLTCGNCTMVCPTCFCTTVEDVTDLGGESAERRRLWDSCFTTEFSYLHVRPRVTISLPLTLSPGGSVRSSSASRYRQWLTHKFGTWFDQFGTSGCVGCGRCITWCPVGIDVVEELNAIRHTPGSGASERGE
ncbi:MAG: 4Fe-4S dicluster domain-containing protein [Trueperaceae bacterium]|nr:MAG: 4Fe-4S dicluster domain-containing protein [Trueperaceae bacterium]